MTATGPQHLYPQVSPLPASGSAYSQRCAGDQCGAAGRADPADRIPGTAAAGYSDKSYFLRRFKQRYGMTPTQFRESVRTGKEGKPAEDGRLLGKG